MIDPWIVDRSEQNFLVYNTTTGFQVANAGNTGGLYTTSAGGTLTMPLNNGTEILNLATATATLGANLDIHALRIANDINNSADNAFNKIIIRSGGLIQAANSPTINASIAITPAHRSAASGARRRRQARASGSGIATPIGPRLPSSPGRPGAVTAVWVMARWRWTWRRGGGRGRPAAPGGPGR